MTATVSLPALWTQLETTESWGADALAESPVMRAVLGYLCRAQHSRAVPITAYQLGRRLGHSDRHVRRSLHVLERLGLIVWTRGHIEDGAPKPGWIRVRLDAMRQLVAHARELARKARSDHAARTRERIRRTVRNSTLWPRKQRRSPLSAHADTVSSPPPRRGEVDARPCGPAASSTSPLPASEGDQAMRVCAAHDIPIIPGESDCAICRRRLVHPRSLTAESLLKPVHTEPRSEDYAANARRGRAAARAAVRAAAQPTQEALL